MFTPFFYILKAKGIEVSLTEWVTLMEALDKGLCHSSLTDFYYLGRMVLVKSETDFDKYDRAFQEYFKGVHSQDEIPPQILEWLDTGGDDEEHMWEDDGNDVLWTKKKHEDDPEQVRRKFQERLEEQHSQHDGGNYWIGRRGGSTFGNAGRTPGGIRINGKTGMRSAFQVIGEERYRDFRLDKALHTRQFEVAFRRLRQFSARLDVPKTELDLGKTIDSTCKNGGYLKLEFDKPRKNTVKLLLLFDSGGTMMPFSSLCNNLFQAVDKANHFKDVKVYYFHNCVYNKLYNTPECENGDWIDTEWVFKNLDSDYRVIFVGDAQMAHEELLSAHGNYRAGNGGLPGIEWLRLFQRKYKKAVWLNPRKHDNVAALEWLESELLISEIFPMYKLSVQGLKEALEKLMVSR